MVQGWDEVRVGDTVHYDIDGMQGYVGEIDLGASRLYLWQDTKSGSRGKKPPKTMGFKYSWVVDKEWHGKITIIHKAKGQEVRFSPKGKETMEKHISNVFEKTKEALVVQKHISGVDDFVLGLIYKDHKEAILKEAQRLEKEEKEKK